MGDVARDAHGQVKFAASRRVRSHWEPLIAEGKAMLMVVRLAKRYGYKKVIMESDSLALVSRLSKALVHAAELGSILLDLF